MNQDTRNTLTRFEKVKAFFDDHAGLVASVGALAAAVATYKGLLAVLPKSADAPGGTTEGATEDKGASRAALAKQLVPLMHALKLYYKKAGDLERARAMDLTRPSSLGTMAVSKFTGLVAKALAYAEELTPGALADYNQPDAKIKAFGTAAEAFGVKKNRPTELRDQQKTAGETLDEQVDEVREYVGDDLASAVGLLADTNPEFVRGFKQANKTDDRPGKQNKALRKANAAKRAAAASGEGGSIVSGGADGNGI
ncbi:hypothetical protein F0P96_19535 [Hymenobacter busanensis]|uniref:Uncharacterized protein n=1 Tax=Hymenobacter busanensis TaxID=2607656 RepID=A0A7L4ZXZ9_9BACT|nr:hypothetical protein [Hymenobacter busanensis]KAA9325526.1 hypothetical protein F0P96_19535 [Hymenobacter busanensis]QHJ07803.1 hypothetical protein GUY19_11130 [Hymenobacter busanensis]